MLLCSCHRPLLDSACVVTNDNFHSLPCLHKCCFLKQDFVRFWFLLLVFPGCFSFFVGMLTQPFEKKNGKLGSISHCVQNISFFFSDGSELPASLVVMELFRRVPLQWAKILFICIEGCYTLPPCQNLYQFQLIQKPTEEHISRGKVNPLPSCPVTVSQTHRLDSKYCNLSNP